MIKGWHFKADGKDISDTLSNKPPIYFGNDMAVYALNPRLAGDIQGIDIRLMKHALPSTRLLSAKDLREWAKRIVIDPKASPVGTVFSARRMGERDWLYAVEPKGLNIWYPSRASARGRADSLTIRDGWRPTRWRRKPA